MITSLLYVAVGGAVGSSLRFLIGQLVAFPLGTLTVNVLGSFAIGQLWAILHARDVAHLTPLLVTGLLGGFTTFSAFSLDALRLVEDGRGVAAAAYVVASVTLSITACGIGLWLGRSIA